MSKVFVFVPSLHCLLCGMNYNAQSLLTFIAMLNHIVKWDLCTWSWLHICLIQGSILVSFSLKSPSPRLVISSYFLSMQQICNNAITPYLTTEDDVFFLAEVGYSSRGYFFSHSSDSHIAWFLWSWKEFARLHLAVTRITSCCHCSDTADKSTKSGWVHQEGNSIAFIEVINQHFHACSNNCICLLSVITFF